MPGERTGAHFLPARQAAMLVRDAAVDEGELVFDLGAGAGSITGALAAAGARVIAVERDPRLVRTLTRRFRDHPAVRVVGGDVREIPLPRRPFRVVANIPFGVTTALLRRLLGDSALTAADIVVADGVLRAVTATRPGNARTLQWSARFSLQRGRFLPARCFLPPPSVDAGVLRVRRRALVSGRAESAAYRTLIAAGYRDARRPWDRQVAGVLTRRQIVRSGIAAGRPVAQLTAADWAALARILSGCR